MIQAILKNKGSRRFQKRTKEGETGETFNINNMTYEEAKDIFKRMTTQTSYGQVFGRKQLSFMDSTILKYHKLSDLPVARALNQVSRTYLENWFALGDDEYYVNLALGFLRGLNTAIRG